MSDGTRGRLVAAAKRAFASHGFRGASVNRIAADAGVTAAMINHHFGGKRGLYDACVEGFGRRRLETIARLVVPTRSLAELEVRLEILLLELLAWHIEELDMVRILMRDVDDPELVAPSCERELVAFSLSLARMFALAQEHGVVDPAVDPTVPASLLYHSLAARLLVDAHRERVQGQTLKDPDFRREHVRAAIQVVLRGVGRAGD